MAIVGEEADDGVETTHGARMKGDWQQTAAGVLDEQTQLNGPSADRYHGLHDSFLSDDFWRSIEVWFLGVN